MADPVPTDPWVLRINALSDFVKMIIPYVIALGASFGWWHTSSNNSAQLSTLNQKVEDSTKQLKVMTGMNRDINIKG